MNSNPLMEPGSVVKTTLRLFALYADFAAGVRAKRVMHQIKLLAGSVAEVSMEMWKLDFVSPAGFIREMIAQEAGESDVLVIAVSAASQPNPAVSRWLESLVNWKMNRTLPGLLVGLFGDEEDPVDEANWLVVELAAFARRTRMDLAWRATGQDFNADTDWLAGRIERLTTGKAAGLACGPQATQVPENVRF